MLIGLDSKCIKIIDLLLTNEESLSVRDIAQRTGMNRRSTYYNLTKINDWLLENQIEQITIHGNGVGFKENQKKSVQELKARIADVVDYKFKPMERIYVLMVTLILCEKKIFIQDLMDICKVSRNTILSDIRQVEEEFNLFNINLTYTPKDGYYLAGKDIQLRLAFFRIFPKVCKLYQKDIVRLEHEGYIKEVLYQLQSISDTLEVEYTSNSLYTISVLVTSMLKKDKHVTFSNRECIEIQSTMEYRLARNAFSDMDESIVLYISLCLLSFRLSYTSVDIIENTTDIWYLATKLVDDFSLISCITFKNPDDLTKALYLHLKSSIFRYKYGIPLVNPMLEEIKTEYPDLFLITSQACQSLEKELNVTISQEEIAYLTLHFGSFTDYRSFQQKILRILVICPHGISTSNMLAKEVEGLVPNSIVEKGNVHIQEDSLDQYDVLISTVSDVKWEHVKSMIVVHPILTDRDRVLILKKCMDSSSEIERPLIEKICKTAKAYISPKQLSLFRKDLEKQLRRTAYSSLTSLSQESNKGLSWHLPIDHIECMYQRIEGKSAIQRMGDILIQKGYINQDYIDSILNALDAYGPYMFISEDIVLAHAKPEDGAFQVGVALIVSKEGITFSQNRIAKMIILISAIDQTQHLSILKDIVCLAKDKKRLENIVSSASKEDILYQIHEMVQANSKQKYSRK